MVGGGDQGGEDEDKEVAGVQEKLTESSSALRLELEEKEETITRLMQEKDNSLKQVELLRLELAALESKVDNAQLLEASNASQMRELADQRSAMESQLAITKRKTSSLEEEQTVSRNTMSAAEKALEETCATLDAARVQYVGEMASAKKLKDELRTLETLMLARANELTAAKEEARLAMAEQKKKNKLLQSELDRV